MTNRGLLDGLGPSLWQAFLPNIRGFSAAGTGITDPVIGASAPRFGQFWNNGQGRVFYQGSIEFDANTTFGTGESVWGLTLPVPASRSNGGADLPIGNCWLWQKGSDPQLNMVAIPTLMDPLLPGGNQGQEDHYFQIFLPYSISYGTGSIATSATSTTVTHNLGYTPSAYDIKIVATNAPSTTPKIVYVNNITSTTFDVNVVSSSATTGLTFAWKIVAEPNGTTNFAQLANHVRPWVWASGQVIAWQIEYEARR